GAQRARDRLSLSAPPNCVTNNGNASLSPPERGPEGSAPPCGAGEVRPLAAEQTVPPQPVPLPAGAREHVAQPLKAIGLMLIAIALFTSVDGLSKYLTADYAPIQIVWVRYLAMLAVLLPLAGWHRAAQPWRTRRPLTQAASGACVAASGLL